MIILVCDWFLVRDKYGIPTGKKEFLASHGFDTYTNKSVIVNNAHPANLGAHFNEDIGEWVIE